MPYTTFAQVTARIELAAQKTLIGPELRASNARLEALPAELNHRVVNPLQLVSAMVRMQATAPSDVGARFAGAQR